MSERWVDVQRAVRRVQTPTHSAAEGCVCVSKRNTVSILISSPSPSDVRPTFSISSCSHDPLNEKHLED